MHGQLEELRKVYKLNIMDKIMKTGWKAIFLVLICTLLISAAQIFLKKGAAVLSFDVISLLTNYSLIIGIVLYFIGAALLITALKMGELSVLYPIIATSYIWVSLLSPIFLNDIMTKFKWIGVAGIFIGVSLIGLGSRR